MGEAPVLTHRGRRISQSGAILTYLADVDRPFRSGAEDRYEALRWILFDNHKFTSYYATLRFMLNFAKTGETPVTEFLRTRAKAAYAGRRQAPRHARLHARATSRRSRTCRWRATCSTPSRQVSIRADTRPSRPGRAHLRNLPGFVAPYDLLPGYPHGGL